MNILSGGRVAAKFLTWSSSALSKSSIFSPVHFGGEISAGFSQSSAFTSSYSCIARISSSSKSNVSVKKKKTKKKEKEFKRSPVAAESLVKRTRSVKELDDDLVEQHLTVDNHIPVMLGEVLDVFSSPDRRLCSFVDCTVGGGGHSSAIIQAHPELQYYVGLDVDPVAHQLAQSRINALLTGDSCTSSDLSSHIILKNFRFIKSLLGEVVDGKLIDPGVDGILMDLGMSSMQVNSPERGFSVLENGPLDMRMDPTDSLTAEQILNSWPGDEVGRILREYGEEHNWFSLQNKIVNSRSTGGFHSTGDLVHLIRCSTPKVKGGRQGWIKTATRVFQALRIAVNDELKTLKDSLYASFDCLAPGGRLAVISFHSLEDRIVKQTFLDIIGSSTRSDSAERRIDEMTNGTDVGVDETDYSEAWIRRVILGENGRILTKRPITPSEKEEKLNRRSRSAKLRVIEKLNL